MDQKIEKQKIKLKEIRSREIKGQNIDFKSLKLNTTEYKTATSNEYFIEYQDSRHIIAFLRLSLPSKKSFIPELKDSALIREVHVYGKSEKISSKKSQTQHRGLGKKLINEVVNIAKVAGFSKLSVISAIGSRNYYSKLGFSRGTLYQSLNLG